MTGPQFTKPTLRNVLCNIPLTVSLIVLVSIATLATIEDISIPLCLTIFVISAFIRDAYDVIHSKKAFFTVPVSLIVSFVLLYRFIHHIDIASQLPLVEGYEVVKWILCGVLWLLSSFILTFILNWMLTCDDDSQSELFERVLNGKVFRKIVVSCIVASLVLFAVSIFNPWFWYDESFTLHLVSLSFADGIDITAHDVHPPLYYIMLKVWLSVLSFGSDNIYVITVLSRLFSVVAYVLTALLCMKKLHWGGE